MKKKSTRYKNGGTSKNQWISEKIAEQLAQGKSLEQATAISNAMYNSGDKMQMGGAMAYNENISKLKDIDRIQSGVTSDTLGKGYYIYNSDGKREFVTDDAYRTTMQDTPQLRDYLAKTGGIDRRVENTENKVYTPTNVDPNIIVNSKLYPIDNIQSGIENSKLGKGYYLKYNNGLRDFITEEAFNANKNNSSIRAYLNNTGGINRPVKGTESKIYRPVMQMGGDMAYNENTNRFRDIDIPISGGSAEQLENYKLDNSVQPKESTSNLKKIDYIQSGISNDKLGRGYYVYTSDGMREFVTDDAYRTTMQHTPNMNRYLNLSGGINRRVPGTESKRYRPFELPTKPMQNGGIPQYQYGNPPVEQSLAGYENYYSQNMPQPTQNFNVPEPTYYDQNKKMFQTRQPAYNGQVPPQTQFSSLGDESDMYKRGDNNLDGVANAQDGIDKFGNPVNSQYNTYQNNSDQYDKTRFANPYGGFDIPTAAHTLGRGIQSGNGFDIATGGLKLLSGLGRNVASGMGYENRRNFVMNEAQRKVREASRPRENYAQYGGYFQEGGMQMGQEAPPQEQGQDMMMQVVDAIQQGADPQEIVTYLIQMGISEEQAVQIVEGVVQQMQGQEQSEIMQMGGQLKKKVVGEHIYENGGEPTLEVETGEYIKKPDGEIREVVGEKHAKGGVKLTEEQVPNGSKIISDHLKVGKVGAKKFNDGYDLGIKSTDTYATILDKFNRKSGIKKIVDEQDMIQKNIEKQVLKLQENPESESTIKLNLQLFTDQFQELQDQKTPLEEARKILFDEVFQPQEESKEQGGNNYIEAQKPIPTDEEEFENGGEKNSLWRNIRNNRGSGKTPTKEMLEQEAKIKKSQMGGMYNDGMIMEYSKKHNLHPDRVRELIQMYQNGGLQQFQNEAFRVSENTNVNSKNKRDKQSPNEEAYGITQSEQALQQLYNNFPDIINSDSSFKQFIDIGQDGKLKFKGGVPLNKQAAIVGNAQRLMDERMVDSANTITRNPTEFSEEAVKEAQRYLQDETFLSNADSFTQDPTKSIRGYDSKLGDFTSGRYSMQMNLVTPEERKILNDAGVTTIKQLKTSPLRQKLSAGSLANVDKVDGLIGNTNADYGIAEITPEKKALETTPAEDTTIKTDGYTASGGKGKTRYTLANLPDQSPLMPDSLQGALKMNHRYDRIETPFVSPDAQITEIRRQEQSAIQGLQGLPDAQRASAIAQIQANSQNALNQAIAQTQGANQSAKFNADVTNAQIQMKEEDMRNNDLQNYENKILTADAKTQRDLRNYYNANQKVNLTNFNAINGLNLINDRFDNAQYDGYGMNMENLQKAKAYDNYMSKNLEQIKAEEDRAKKANKINVKSKLRYGGKK